MDMDLLTKSILKLILSPNPDRMLYLQGEILDMPEFYLVAEPGTTQENWASGNYHFYIDQKRTLTVFLSSAEAAAFASRMRCVLPSGDFPIVSKDNDTFTQLVADYAAQQLISSVKIYARMPINIEFAPEDFQRGAQAPIPVPTPAPAAPPAPTPQEVPPVPTATRVFQGVEEVKKSLETYETNARRKLDPGTRYEHIHTLIQTLSQQNGIDPEELDRILNLPNGYSRDLFRKGGDVNLSIDIMKRYLSFFGLQEYLYIYRSDSRELARHLGAHKYIDKFELKKSAPSPTAERFKLEEIARMTDGHMDNVFVYKIKLTSDKGNVAEFVVSNPLKPPLIIGKEYQLLHRGGRVRDEDEKPQGITGVSKLPGDDEMAALLASLDEKEKKKSNPEKAPRSYEETRKDEIIKYFKMKCMDVRSATSKYRDLEVEPDILDEFYKYITKKQFGKLELFGYTARKLIKEMHMEPYEAFLSLVQLRSDPQQTKQRLLYRERDPQYQRKPKGKEGGDS